MFASYTFYKLDDGRVWDIVNAMFVDGVPEGAEWSRPVGVHGKADDAGLEECLRFFGWPLGEFKNDADFAAEVRAKRDTLLAETDYLVMPDYPLPEDRGQAVLAYRQALRDVPEQAGFPRQIDWPVKP
jgi:hypothetical protein